MADLATGLICTIDKAGTVDVAGSARTLTAVGAPTIDASGITYDGVDDAHQLAHEAALNTPSTEITVLVGWTALGASAGSDFIGAAIGKRQAYFQSWLIEATKDGADLVLRGSARYGTTQHITATTYVAGRAGAPTWIVLRARSDGSTPLQVRAYAPGNATPVSTFAATGNVASGATITQGTNPIEIARAISDNYTYSNGRFLGAALFSRYLTDADLAEFAANPDAFFGGGGGTPTATKIAITAEPAGAVDVGQTVTIVAAAQDAGGATDTSYATGTWRLRARSAPTGWDLSTVLDSDTPAAGVAALTFTVPMAGTWTFGVDDDADALTDSPATTATTATMPAGGGGTTTIISGGSLADMDLLMAGAASRRTLVYLATDATTGAPATSLTGKPSVSINGAAASTTPAESNAAHLGGGYYAVPIADASLSGGAYVVVTAHGAARIQSAVGRAVAVDVGTAGQTVAVDGSNRVVPAPAETTAAVEAATITATVDTGAVATAVWASPTRTLSSFGTLASDAAAAVWATANKIVSSVTGAVGSVTGNVGGNVAGSVGSVTAGVTISGASITSIVNGVWGAGTRTLSNFGTLAADIASAVWGAGTRTLSTWTGAAAAVWGELTSALSVDGSIGKRLADNVDATTSSRLAAAQYVAPNNAAIATIQAATDQLATMLETDGPVYRYTTNALENSPAGSGGGTADWTTAEREQIRYALGLTGTKTATAGGVLDAIREAALSGGVKVLAADITAIAGAVGGHAVVQEILANSLPWPAISRHEATRYGTMTVKAQDGTVLGYRLVTYASTGASAPPIEFGPLLPSAPTIPAS